MWASNQKQPQRRMAGLQKIRTERRNYQVFSEQRSDASHRHRTKTQDRRMQPQQIMNVKLSLPPVPTGVMLLYRKAP